MYHYLGSYTKLSIEITQKMCLSLIHEVCMNRSDMNLTFHKGTAKMVDYECELCLNEAVNHRILSSFAMGIFLMQLLTQNHLSCSAHLFTKVGILNFFKNQKTNQ